MYLLDIANILFKLVFYSYLIFFFFLIFYYYFYECCLGTVYISFEFLFVIANGAGGQPNFSYLKHRNEKISDNLNANDSP